MKGTFRLWLAPAGAAAGNDLAILFVGVDLAKNVLVCGAPSTESAGGGAGSIFGL